jgi:tRNA(Phe) wybutosine-synthesizing methylase Tyw3
MSSGWDSRAAGRINVFEDERRSVREGGTWYLKSHFRSEWEDDVVERGWRE